ncbi:MAG: tetratricopeptide repeat protein [Methylovulum sp.]|nr:tetratricopeptide repeat protein [Methylovulum sp.]
MKSSILCLMIMGIISVNFTEKAEATESCGVTVGKFVAIEGAIELEHSDQKIKQSATLESTLCQNDIVYVGQNSRAALSLINEVVLRLDQNTTMRLADVAPEPEKRSLVELIVGAFKSFSRPPRTFAVNTPYLNGLIEGTEFAMRVEGDNSITTVYEGKVTTSNNQGKLTLKRGESAFAKAGKAPQPYTMVKPSDAVQWTLHFPPLLAVLGGKNQHVPQDASPTVKTALELASHSDTPKALKLLEDVPMSERNASYHLYRAALFLDIGRADEARSDITAALLQDPKNGFAYALQAIIEISRNEHQQALASAEQAVTLTPSAASKIALSYAQQSAFELEKARDTLLTTVSEYPNDPLAWARLGELWLMFGDRGKALEAARKAEELAPGLARSQTVFGFAALAESHEAEAKIAFEQAIRFSSDDPLAHFGLGLAKIKHGDLTEGRRELEAAVALDPNNALLRSYLGKAYYEEKRSPLEGQQFDIAKELDPADPTPYLYSAIDKQTSNRPVEALHDMQKAIDLNDNRAVYRSRQLLDSDLASRSASMARVYSDLGFQELALRQGWKSVNVDPSNFSAHRFLADSYSVLPRHEIARVSELLQSQLLQPINMTPIQPRLGESNLFLISAGGPGALSFNEFNPIFNRDGITVQANSVVGENNTYAGEGVVSGIYKKASFSVGGFHYTSNGYRENAGQKDDIANAFVQYELSPKTSIQAEYRYRDAEIGDLQLRFFPDEYYPGQRTPQEKHTYRFGARHSFSDSSILLGSFTYTNAKFGAYDNAPFVSPGFITALNLKEPQEAFGSELQHLFRSTYVNLTTGVGYFDRNSTSDLTANTILPPPDNVMPFPTQDTDQQHINAYSYSNIKPRKDLTFTVGVSGDFTHEDVANSKDIEQINPKLGVIWSPWQDTTLRAAWFSTLKRSLVNNQTLEPTQVAGFNQFYDDFNATKAWRYGTGIDQKLTKNLFAGIEVSKRDLNVPATDQFGEAIRVGWQEELARTYLFWTPHPWLAMRLEYQYEQIKRDALLTDGVQHLETHRVPLGINFFHPTGLGAGLKLTYFNQAGQFESIKTGMLSAGHDDFWVVDAMLNYRLPKRYGFFSIGATNLFNQNFSYFDIDFNNPSIAPTRMAYARLTLAFP